MVASLLIAVVAWAGFTGPDRTQTVTVRDRDEDQWYCDKAGYPTCWFSKAGEGGQDCDGSHPSTGSQNAVCGWIADDCGCVRGYRETTTTLPPATVSGSEVCATPGNGGWCRSGAAIALSANEPVSGEVIQLIEGNPGGVLCDPADASSVSCSWTGGGEGSFTVEFWAVSSYGDTSHKGTADWKLDGTAPSINLNVPGGSGWNRGGSYTVSVSGADATSGVAAAEASVNGGPWAGSVEVSGDGIHAISGRVIDGAGNQATQSAEIKIDGTPPGVAAEVSGTRGREGWYISPVTVSASASDALSGVAVVEVSLDGGSWQPGPLVVSADGTHSSRVRASDRAGNQTTASGPTLRIDAHPPQSVFIDPPNESAPWVSGLVEMHGTSMDLTSGLLTVEISYDQGASWEPLALRGMEWSATWDVSGLPTGDYPVLARARDVAGHLESTARITLRIDTTGPLVEIPDAWLVDEAAPVVVRDQHIGLASAVIEIGDALVYGEYGPQQIPEAIEWDGTLPDGSQASPGEYPVHVTAWDLAGNRGQDAGLVIVPEGDSELQGPPIAADGGASDAVIGGSNAVALGPRRSEARSVPIAELTFDVWLWPALAWMGLVGTIGFAKILDPRPGAIRGLRQDLKQIRHALED